MAELRVAVIVVSDRASDGTYEDRTGPAVAAELSSWPGAVVSTVIVIPDQIAAIASAITRRLPDADLILTAGGTGLGERDVTPEATRMVIEREVPGIAEYLRSRSVEVVTTAVLSRGIAGTNGQTLVINLPGSPNGAAECTQWLHAIVPHAVAQLRGGNHE